MHQPGQEDKRSDGPVARPARRGVDWMTGLAVFTALTACGGGGGSGAPAVATPTALDCTSLQFSATQARPGAAVIVSGGSAFGIDENATVEVATASGRMAVTGFTPRSDGTLELAAPLHPDLDLAGGAVTLRIVGATQACAPLPFTVLALPATTDATYASTAMGRLQALVALAQQKTAAGVSVADLRDKPLAELPPLAVPAAMMATVMQGVEGLEAQLAALPADKKAYVQAVLAEADVQGLANSLIASFEAAPTLAARAVPANTAVTQAPQPLLGPGPRSVKLAAGGITDFATCGPLGSVDAGLFDLSSPQSLSDYLKVSAQLKADLNGPLGRSFRTLSSLFGALGLLVPEAGQWVGVALYAAELAVQMRINLYPNALDELSIELDKTRIEEDWSSVVYGDPPIKWYGAQLYATNSGMAILRPGIDGLLNLIGLSDKSFIVKVPVRGVDFLGKNELAKRLDKLQADKPTLANCWTIGSTRFGPVAVPDDDFFRWLDVQVGGDAILHDFQTREIIPARLGTSTLEVRSRQEHFPGPVVLDRKSITVPAKSVRFLPGTLNRVDKPGDVAEVQFRLDDTKQTDRDHVTVQITDSRGGAVAKGAHQVTGNLHSIMVSTPADRTRFPLDVRVTSNSITLEPSTPGRGATQNIIVGDGLQITPATGVCLAHGGTQRFTAAYSGEGTAPAVTWEVVSGGGSVNPASGLVVDYLAPGTDSTVTLRVSLDADPRVQDEVSFQVGRCVGMAVYYQHNAQVSFPGGDSGCASDELGLQEQEEKRFDMPDLRQAAPVSDFWFGRETRISYDPAPTGVAVRGLGTPTGCADTSFNGRATLNSLLAASADGSRLDVDIAGQASNQCKVSGATGTENCSQGTAGTEWVAQYELKVGEAVDYRVQMQMDCSRTLRPPESTAPFNLSVSVYRFLPDGTLVLSNRDFQKAFLPGTRNFACFDAQSAVRFDETIEFDAAAVASQPDRVVVIVFSAHGAAALRSSASGGPGLADDGSMKGFVQVTRVAR